MGNTLWIDVHERSGKETHQDMNILLCLGENLDALADRLGVTKLTAFYDYSPLLEAACDDEPSADASPSWFDSSQGLKSVRALLDRLDNDWGSLNWQEDQSTEHYRSTLLENLRLCERVLEKAVVDRQPFRLMIVS